MFVCNNALNNIFNLIRMCNNNNTLHIKKQYSHFQLPPRPQDLLEDSFFFLNLSLHVPSKKKTLKILIQFLKLMLINVNFRINIIIVEILLLNSI